MTGLLLQALTATIAIEVIVLLALGERSRKVLLASVAVNIMTNPAVNICLHTLQPTMQAGTILAAELLIAVTESAWYYLFVRQWSRAFTYGFLCNAVSFLTGLLLQLIITSLTLNTSTL